MPVPATAHEERRGAQKESAFGSAPPVVEHVWDSLDTGSSTGGKVSCAVLYVLHHTLVKR